MILYKEKTDDRGAEKLCSSREGDSFVLTSAYAKDLYWGYLDKYGKLPATAWYKKHFNFIKKEC